MKTLIRRDANALRHRLQQRAKGLGDYGEVNVYSEADVFRSETPGQLMVNGQPAPDPYYNPISFTPYAFAISNTSGNNGSVQILSNNVRRQFLLIQNLSIGSNLWVNFGSNAGVDVCLKLTQGTGVFFDTAVPNNSIAVYFDAATNESGVIIEGAPTY